MKLHVCTAVSRPWNLNVVAKSLEMSADRVEIDLSWHLRFDLGRGCLGGQALKNELLDDISDGWVWFLDDDTLVHEDMLSIVLHAINGYSDVTAVVVSQRRNDGRVLLAKPRNVCVNGIDIGQAILRRDLIGDERIPESYAGDGEFLQTLLHDRQDVIYMSEVLSLHNVLSGLDIASRQTA